jgi:hypothetical protein
MLAKYDLGSGDFDISSSTATLAYTWLRVIQDFTDGISATGLALNTQAQAQGINSSLRLVATLVPQNTYNSALFMRLLVF